MIKQNRRFFIDVDYLTEPGHGSSAPGSVFVSNVPEDKTRVVSVLAKGEGGELEQVFRLLLQRQWPCVWRKMISVWS